MHPIRILLADDHEVVRFGLSSLINKYDDLNVVAEASSGEQAFELFCSHSPDISILDITMPGIDGIETAKKIKAYDPDAYILILTMHSDNTYVKEILKIRVNGYIQKNSKKEELIETIRAVASGKHVFSPTITRMLTDHFVDSGKSLQSRRTPFDLTPREQEILSLISEGKSTKDIAQQLHISTRTVETHRSNLLSKTGVKNSAGLVRYALSKKISG